jgi:murein L,D-transpeptidase YcbB/YkuD
MDLKSSTFDQFRFHIFDPDVVLALKQFQRRHGLVNNGKLSKKTLSALNMLPAQRLGILQTNLWRWLSLPSVPPEQYLLVNIPFYHLSWVEGKREKLSMKVVVGKAQNPTPIMVTELSYLTVNPYWTPTENIVKNELLLQNTQSPGSLKKQGFTLVKGGLSQAIFKNLDTHTAMITPWLKEYRLVQLPGKNNALGKFRFNIKNFHSVYLHDTPVKNVFEQKNRALSHGCIRLQNPQQLVMKVLENEKKSKHQRVNKALKNQTTQHIKLNTAIPVFTTYQTVWVKTNGKLHWRPDIYQLDRLDPIPAQFYTTVSNIVLATP